MNDTKVIPSIVIVQITKMWFNFLQVSQIQFEKNFTQNLASR